MAGVVYLICINLFVNYNFNYLFGPFVSKHCRVGLYIRSGVPVWSRVECLL